MFCGYFAAGIGVHENNEKRGRGRVPPLLCPRVEACRLFYNVQFSTFRQAPAPYLLIVTFLISLCLVSAFIFPFFLFSPLSHHPSLNSPISHQPTSPTAHGGASALSAIFPSSKYAKWPQPVLRHPLSISRTRLLLVRGPRRHLHHRRLPLAQSGRLPSRNTMMSWPRAA